MSESLSKIKEALDVAKLYIIRYPNKSADKVIRSIDDARVVVIGMEAAEPKYDDEGNELQGCEGCPAVLPLEQMHCSTDDGWFCPECVAHWQAEAAAVTDSKVQE